MPPCVKRGCFLLCLLYAETAEFRVFFTLASINHSKYACSRTSPKTSDQRSVNFARRRVFSSAAPLIGTSVPIQPVKFSLSHASIPASTAHTDRGIHTPTSYQPALSNATDDAMHQPHEVTLLAMDSMRATETRFDERLAQSGTAHG